MASANIFAGQGAIVRQHPQGGGMTTSKFHPKVLKLCVWTGPLFCVLWLVGAGPLALFILPPESAAHTALKTVSTYTEHLTAVRIGCVLMIFSSMIYCVWAVVVTLYTREAEGHRPALFWIQMLSLACCEVVVMLIGFFWGVAAFRAGQASPDVTQALNDLGWFGVLFTGAPFAMYMIALAGSIFLDKSERPPFPRWVAYLNLFVTFFMFEACLIAFFKHGAFSQNGLMVFYVPMIVFFVWIVVMTTMVMKAVNREQEELMTAERAGVAEKPETRTPVAV
jgi:hypothetical protein